MNLDEMKVSQSARKKLTFISFTIAGKPTIDSIPRKEIVTKTAAVLPYQTHHPFRPL
jgi:hypothetical protein